MKLNNEIMLIGVACLVVGGAAGYLLSAQSQEEYLTKGYNTGLVMACYSERNQDQVATAECIENAKEQHAFIESLEDPEYLTKLHQGTIECPPWHPKVCDSLESVD